jgi:tryptophan synthase beta chain
MLAKKLGKKEVIAETGAGQHGVACASACAKFKLKLKVFMGQKDIQKQYPNVFWMRKLGAQVVPVCEGDQKLTEAVDAAMGAWIENPDSYYMLGSAVGPHPYPEIMRASQKVIGEEIRSQLKQATSKYNLKIQNGKPNTIIACIGGGSNALGAFEEFLYDQEVDLIAVEAGGQGFEKGQHSSKISSGQSKLGVFEGFKSLFLMTNQGQISSVGGISAGLGYVGIGPLHAYLHSTGRLKFALATDREILEAFDLVAKQEGLLVALESCHAVTEAIKIAPRKSQDEVIVVNLSGRADNYLFSVAEGFKDQEFLDFCKTRSS